MADKWKRNYQLSVQGPLGIPLIIEPPFTLEMDITRNTLTSANVCKIRLYNLAPLTRNMLRFNISDYGTFRKVELKAGYGDDLYLVFSGNVSAAWSMREGANFVSTIECYDGGFAFATGRVNTQFPAGTPRQIAIRGIAAQGLPNVKPGAVGVSYSDVLKRGNSYAGNTMEILGEMTGGGAFIDNGVFNALGTNDFIVKPGPFLIVDAARGLLGTPMLEQTIVRFDMIFEPALEIGTQILLNSEGEDAFDGFYKVTAVKHRGVISDAVAGSLVTTGEFLYSKLLVPAI